MAATCPGCAKTVSGDKPTCYYCGAFLAPRVECPKCKRAIPQTRTTCHFCGTSLTGAKLADPASPASPAGPANLADPASPAAPPAAAKPAPASLVRPNIVLEQPTAFGAWCEAHQTKIDLALLVLALPIVACAMATQAIVGMFARMRSSGGS
jgi:hypothetical protein